MKKKKVDCKRFEEMIPSFIDDMLDNDSAEEFLEHMENCPECKEELHIQYLVREGINRLEEGDTFNLGKELAVKIAEYARFFKYRRQATAVLYVFEVIAVVSTVALIILVIFSNR